MKFISHNTEETEKIANDLAKNLSIKEKASVVGLYGELGAGKTTFAQMVAKALGVEEKVASPTFVILKIYELNQSKFKHLIHIDAYRIEKPDELLHLGWSEITADRENLILVEWPENVSEIMPEHTKVIFKALEDRNQREIEVV